MTAEIVHRGYKIVEAPSGAAYVWLMRDDGSTGEEPSHVATNVVAAKNWIEWRRL